MRKKSVGAEGAFHCFTAIYTLISLRCVFLAQKILISPKLIRGLQPPYIQHVQTEILCLHFLLCIQKQEERKATLTSYFQSFHSPDPESLRYSTFLSPILHIYRSLNTILTLHLSKLFIPQSKFQSRSSFLKWLMW